MTQPSTIADRVRPFLSPLLAQALDTRTAEGLAKYGQTLDDNHKPDRAKVVHFLQELLDASQYAEWWEQDSMHVPLLTNLANQVAAEFPDLTLDELLFKEGHSRSGATDSPVAPESAVSYRPTTDPLQQVQSDKPSRNWVTCTCWTYQPSLSGYDTERLLEIFPTEDLARTAQRASRAQEIGELDQDGDGCQMWCIGVGVAPEPKGNYAIQPDSDDILWARCVPQEFIDLLDKEADEAKSKNPL